MGTRRQAVMIKKEKKNSRGKTKKRKRVVNAKREQQNQEQEKPKRVRKPEKKKTFELRTPTSDRIRRSTAFYGSSTNTTPTSSGSDEVRKIVQEIMEEMLAKVEKASKVIHQAERFNLDVVKAKEVSQSRRNSTDSNCSLKHIHEQIPPVEEILDIVKEEPEREEAIKDNPATEEVIEPKNRRSSFAASFYDGNSIRSSKRRKSRLSKELIENEVVDDQVKTEDKTLTENSSGDVEKSEENIQATEKVDLNDKVEDKIASIDENEDKPVIQLKKRGRKPKVKTSKKRQKKINHQSGTSKTTEIEHLEEPKIEMNGVEESEIEPSAIPVTPKRRSTIATDTSIETQKPESAAKSNQGQQRRKSIHNVLQKLIEHSVDTPTENVIETVDTNDDPTAKEAIENTQAEIQCKTEDEGLEKPIKTESPPKSSRPHRRSSFAASFYLSGSTELEDEILSKRSRKRKQSSSPQDQPEPTVSSEVIEEPSKETNEVNQTEEDEEEKPIVHLKKRKRKSPTLESEPQIVKSSDVSNLENTEKPFMDEDQPIKPRQR